MSKGSRSIVAAGVLAALAFGLAPATAASGNLDISLCAPGSNQFTASVTNRYFPLPVGQKWVLVGPDEGEIHTFQVTVESGTEDFHFGRRTVSTRIVEEREWAENSTPPDGIFNGADRLIEVSINYFAQVKSGAQPGTACYFGEHVDIYDPTGQFVESHDGSWRADDPQDATCGDPTQTNAPGIFMPAAPKPGMKFAQEFAPCIAEDQASIVGSQTVTVPAGTFPDAIRVRESNPIDGDRGYKQYAPGVGLLTDGGLQLQAGYPR